MILGYYGTSFPSIWSVAIYGDYEDIGADEVGVDTDDAGAELSDGVEGGGVVVTGVLGGTVLGGGSTCACGDVVVGVGAGEVGFFCSGEGLGGGGVVLTAC